MSAKSFFQRWSVGWFVRNSYSGSFCLAVHAVGTVPRINILPGAL